MDEGYIFKRCDQAGVYNIDTLDLFFRGNKF
jgi:hypothetical protein